MQLQLGGLYLEFPEWKCSVTHQYIAYVPLLSDEYLSVPAEAE